MEKAGIKGWLIKIAILGIHCCESENKTFGIPIKNKPPMIKWKIILKSFKIKLNLLL